MTDLNAFFARLGMPPDTVPIHSIEFLSELQRRWVLSIPYENIDILRGIPISLDPERIYRKLILEKRGGYCFESNCLLEHILKRLGFQTVSYLARFLRGESEIPVRRHRVVAVFLGDKTYIMDVGVGAVAPRLPLLLRDGLEQEQGSERYRFRADPVLGRVVEELHAREGWRPLYAFREESQLEVDFIQPSFYCEKHPDSPFNKDYMIAIKTEDGRKTISGSEFRVFSGDTLVSSESELSDGRRREILSAEFGILV